MAKEAEANFSTLDEEGFKVMRGDTSSESRPNLKIIRIFTSSTFTDTDKERNALMEKVYPVLRSYCQEQGYEFQVVDMRWGVRAESTDDHATTDLCLNELQNCKSLSTGPFFVTFLGQKYGFRPFPTRIPQEEYMTLIGAMEEADKALLAQWFVLDENNVPPTYILQSISTRLPHFNGPEDTPENKALRDEDQKSWWDMFGRMQGALQRASKALKDRKRAKYYIMSVTENEIQNGIINVGNCNSRCLWFRRTITDLNDHLSDPFARRYIDIQSDGNVDSDAVKLLDDLESNAIPAVLKGNNIIKYNIKWANGAGIDPDKSNEHKNYIARFCSDFEARVQSEIAQSIKMRATQQHDMVYEEAVHHLHFTKNKIAAFSGREDILTPIMNYIKSTNSGAPPCVVYGESGCGKTSIMAKVAAMSFALGNTMVFTRYLGTSAGSTPLRHVLSSLFHQVARATDDILMALLIPSETKELIPYFKKLVTELKDKPDTKFVFVLDSLDQLSPENGALMLKWLPLSLPPNVRIVVSTLPGKQYEAFPTLESLFEDKKLFFQVPVMPLKARTDIIDTWLKQDKRQLSSAQYKLVEKALEGCGLPLYFKLVYDQAKKWPSYQSTSSISIAPDVKSIITQLFERLERKHGVKLVSHALGFLTASLNGLSEAEMEDLLSLDDEVLDDVYEWWTPPLRRIPPLLWTRIRADLGDYLTERGSDGVRVFYWYHRQFIETARERYLADAEQAKARHGLLAEYFSGKWAGTKKPYTEKATRKTIMADRHVAAMPNFFESETGRVYNLRRLTELPYHLSHADMHAALETECSLNFDFLFALVNGKSASDAMSMFSLEGATNTTKLLKDAVGFSAAVLNTHPTQLAPQLLGRLQSFVVSTNNEGGRVKRELSVIIDKCRQYCKKPENHTIYPQHGCLEPPGSALVALFPHDRKLKTVAVNSDGTKLVCIDPKTCTVWNTKTRNMVSTIALTEKKGNPCSMRFTPDDESVIFGHYKAAHVLKLSSGIVIKKFSINDGEEGTVDCVALTPDGKYLAVVNGSGPIYVFDFASGEKVARHDGHLYVDPDDGEKTYSTVHLAATEDFLVTGGIDDKLRVWNFRLEEQHCIDFDYDEIVVPIKGNRFLTRYSGKRSEIDYLVIFDATTGTELKRFHEQKFYLTCMTYSPDRTKALVVSDDEQAWVFDLTTNEVDAPLVEFSLPASEDQDVESAAMTNAVDLFLAFGQLVQQYDKNATKQQLTYDKYSQNIEGLVVPGSDKFVVTHAYENEENGSMRFWDMATGRVEKTFSDQSNQLRFTSDLKKMIAVDSISFHIYDMATKEQEFELILEYEDLDDNLSEGEDYDDNGDVIPSTMKYPPEEKKALRAKMKAELKIARRLKNHNDDVAAFVGSPLEGGAAYRIITCSSDETIKIMRYVPGKSLDVTETLIGHTGSVQCLAEIGRDKLVSGGDDNTLMLWDLNNYSMINMQPLKTEAREIVYHGEKLYVLTKTTVELFSPALDPLQTLCTADLDIPYFSVAGDRMCACLHSKKGWLVKIVGLGVDVPSVELPNSTVKYSKVLLTSTGVVVTSVQRTLTVWDGEAGKKLSIFVADVDISVAAISRDEKAVYVGFGPGPVTSFLLPELTKQRVKKSGVNLLGGLGLSDPSQLKNARSQLSPVVQQPKTAPKISNREDSDEDLNSAKKFGVALGKVGSHEDLSKVASPPPPEPPIEMQPLALAEDDGAGKTEEAKPATDEPLAVPAAASNEKKSCCTIL